MTEFPGLRAGFRLAEGPATSGSLGKGAWSTSGPALWAASLPRGPQDGSGVVAVAHGSRSGIEEGLYGGRLLFERVIVTPRVREAGFVLSEQAWTVDVWNTHRRLPRTLSSIQITGGSGLAIGGTSPREFGSMQAVQYTATLGMEGPALVDNVVVWVFAGVSGTDLRVTGSRLTLFSARIDWNEPFHENLGWKTTVLTAYSGAEQRAGLRTRPRVALSFRVATTTPRENAALEALVHGWQARVFGVPVWPERSQLLADAATGATVLQVDTQDRPSVEAGGLVALWRDPFTWKAFSVVSVSTGTVTLATRLTEDWPAGSWVLPVRRGRLLDEQALGRPTNWLRDGTFTFSCEAL